MKDIIAIVDYGVGNLFSLVSSFKYIGADITVTSDPDVIKSCDKIILPMDEALIMCALDISGRGGLYYGLEIPACKVGDFDTELCEEFFRAFVRESGITLHIRQLSGSNSHHIIEGTFKAVARVLSKGVSIDEKYKDEIPSTKGVI